MPLTTPAKHEPKKPATTTDLDMRPHAVMARKAAMKARQAPEPTPEAAAVADSQVAGARINKAEFRPTAFGA